MNFGFCSGSRQAMKQSALRFFLIAIIAASAGVLSAAFAPAFAQADAPEASRGAPQDWSHRHLLYTNPDTRDEAARKGTLAFEKWKQKNKDPRHAAQVARKARFVQPSERSPFSSAQRKWAQRFHRDPPPAAGQDTYRDWSNVLGGAAGVGKANIFPAKFGADFASADCAGDFVVYTTTSPGATGSGAPASQTSSFSQDFTGGTTRTVTITHTGSPPLVLTSNNTTTNSGFTFAQGGSIAATATNLANAINRNGGTAGVTATSAGALVTLTAITTGATGANTTLASSTGRFTWTANTLTGGSGTAGQPTIVAFNRLYKTTCETASTPLPATFWSYNTGNGAIADSSPVLSLDGAQVAFVQRTAGLASLVLLKWSSTLSVGTAGVPTTLTNTPLANYRACTAPCMTVIALSGSPDNSNSSPYYVYGDDILFVGDDSGNLHKFTGVFGGTPAEVTGTGWPVAVSPGNILTSPVFDSGSGLIFVGSTAGAASGGRLHSVNSSGAVVSSGPLARANSSGVRDAPIVDSAAQRVYAFVATDVSGTTAGICTTSPCAAVYQFTTAFSSGNTGTKVQVGRGSVSTTGSFLYAGTFDDAYYNSAVPASPTGHLYVCGNQAGAAQRPTLWQIPISGNAMGNAVLGPTLVSNNNADCSAITEVMNNGNDYIYASVTARGNDTGCTGACIYMFNLTGLTWRTSAVATAGFQATGGTSGIIIDNISSTTGASQIYYSTLGAGGVGNAIQASQAGLQ
jgi:hypothetical protein